MSTASKSFFTFLAGAAAATAAAMYIKSENGRKVSNTVSNSFKKNIRGIHDTNLTGWLDDIETSAKKTTVKFKERIGL
jgi:hypothetical protein